jgi:hypothetical protein
MPDPMWEMKQEAMQQAEDARFPSDYQQTNALWGTWICLIIFFGWILTVFIGAIRSKPNQKKQHPDGR